jgi:hypothetical protein
MPLHQAFLGALEKGGSNLQCTFLIKGWHGWDNLKKSSSAGAKDAECAAMWTRARAAFDFVGTTSEMQVALARLSVLTGMEATLTVRVDLQHLARATDDYLLGTQRSHIGRCALLQ